MILPKPAFLIICTSVKWLQILALIINPESLNFSISTTISRHLAYVKNESESHSAMSHSLRPHGLYSLWNSPGQNTRVGSCSLLEGVLPTQGLDPGLPHCRQILYQLSHQGSPRILEWVAYAFSRGLPDPGIKPGSPALQVDSLPAEKPGKPI